MAARATRRILLVEDDPTSGEALRYSLEATGFQVYVAHSGKDALALVAEHGPHLILLDVQLPDMSGYEVCRKIRARARTAQPAVIFVAARALETDRVAAFEVGADDFVAKPYSLSELMLRIHARLLARGLGKQLASPGAGQAERSRLRMVLGPLEIDQGSHRVFLADREVALSVQEMRLLNYLASEPGKMRTRSDLLSAVWGYHPDATSRTLDTHVKRLRDKFGDHAGMIQTVHGVGYRIATAPVDVKDSGRKRPGRARS